MSNKLPPNFFELYHEYVADTEPPPNFHAWSAIGAVGALLGKKCYIPQGHFTVFPNTYIVLVGHPGTRKSTAMNIAKRLVRLVETVPVAAESGSREGLLDDMSKNKVDMGLNRGAVPYWQSAAFVTEMQEFLGGKHINQAMVGFLTAIWDESYYKERTRKGGEVIIHNPYFTLLGCCTPNWMNEKLKQDVITDGFSRRAIFALEDKLNKLNAWPESTPRQLEILALLQNEAIRIHQMVGQFRLTPEARAVYDAAYLGNMEDAKKFSDKVQSYFTSKHVLVLKISMAISAALNSSLMITKEQIDMALKFLSQSERALDTVFAGVGRNELKSYADKVLHRIQLAGDLGISKGTLMGICYDDLQMTELSEIVEVLTRSGQVRMVSTVSQGEPVLVATQKIELPPAERLLLEASQLKPFDVKTRVGPLVSAPTHLLDPKTAQHLTHQAQMKQQTAAGLLLKGRPLPNAVLPQDFSK